MQQKMILAPFAHGTTIHHERKLTMKHIKRVIIIGGGVLGLVAGVLLARTVTMPELASRGGSIVELYTPIPNTSL
jgi:threonine dehydrogenase-like Zn-dependent dehydrogenase